MADIIQFPLIRGASASYPEKNGAQIFVFPQTRRAPLIERAAQRLRRFGSDEAGDYLIALLELVQDEMPVGHVNQDAIDNQLIALARAIKSAARSSREHHQPGGAA